MLAGLGLPEPGCPGPVGGRLRPALVSNLGQPALEGTGSDLWGRPVMPLGVPCQPVRVPGWLAGREPSCDVGHSGQCSRVGEGHI